MVTTTSLSKHPILDNNRFLNSSSIGVQEITSIKTVINKISLLLHQIIIHQIIITIIVLLMIEGIAIFKETEVMIIEEIEISMITVISP